MPSGIYPRRPQTERFWEKVAKADGCWEWLGAKNQHGYGRIATKPHWYSAHRVAYEYLVGPIAEGMQIDHLCRNPGCVNPEHMEVVTPKENYLRGFSPPALNARRTVCVKGHSLADAIKRMDGHRVCRACNKARNHRWRAEHPEYNAIRRERRALARAGFQIGWAIRG